MTKAERDLESLAWVAHGMLVAIHGLAVVWNWQKGNKSDMAIHSVVLAYDLHAAIKHWKKSHD